VCRATSENACFMTLARLSLSRGRGRARRLDPTFSIRAFDRQPRKSSLAILPMWASAPKAPLGAERAIGFAMCGGGFASVRRLGRGGGSLLRRGAPSGAAIFDEAEAPHPLCWPVWGRGGKFEVEEIGAAARRSGVARIPDGAVAGEMGEELHHRDLRAVFGGEPGEAIGALSRATSTGDPDDDVGVGGEDIRARHEQNITRTHGREKVVRAWATALAIEAEGGDAGAGPFTRARSAPQPETPPRGGPADGLWICARQRGRSNSRRCRRSRNA
jgi:hypothetical protein